jgi:hypothetical protein
MKFTTQSDCPVTADVIGDSIVLTCEYTAHRTDKKTNDFKRVEVSEVLTLTFDELEQIYNHFKETMGETE